MTDTYSPWFWNVIAHAHGDEERLRSALEGMSRDQIARFYREFTEAAAEVRCAPCISRMRNLSEDGLSDVSEYVVAQGRDYYDQVLNNPHLSPPSLPLNPPSFKGMALTVFWDRYGESIPR